MTKYLLLALIAVLFSSSYLFAVCKAETPQDLVNAVGESFVMGDIERFSCLFEVEDGISRLRWSVESKYQDKNYQRKVEGGMVLTSSGNKATLLLMALIIGRNSGDETYLSGPFSGIFEAERSDSGWKVKRVLPYRENLIRSQTLDVDVIPGKSLIVRDTLSIVIKGNYGFAVMLNHKAKISKVRLNGKNIEFKFGGGLLWLNAASTKLSQLLLEYELDEIDSDEKNANSSFWGNEFGHVRNQFWWHPFFDANNENGFASFRVTARIQKSFRLVTSLPQTEKLVGEYRFVSAESLNDTPALALFYDKEWEFNSKSFGGIRFETFVSSSFVPTIAEMQKEFHEVYTTLEAKFGKPVSDYFCLVQDRSRRGGWLYLTNNTVTSGNAGGEMRINQKFVRAPFAHEISHAWTTPTGKGANFLREGWASFAETYFIREKFGDAAVAKYFENFRKDYEAEGFENRVSILGDVDNGGISYSKGLWIFKMLRDFVGEDSFEKGMRKYISESRLGKKNIESFTSSFDAVSQKRARIFLKPWLEEKVLPNVSAQVVNGKLEVTQTGVTFVLPLEIEFETEAGNIRKSYLISKPKEIFDLPDLGEIKGFRIDPSNQLLLKRTK